MANHFARRIISIAFSGTNIISPIDHRCDAFRSSFCTTILLLACFAIDGITEPGIPDTIFLFRYIVNIM